MVILGHDIYITTRNPKDAAKSPRQFFSWHQGWTINDTEIYWGKYEVVISKQHRPAPHTLRFPL